MIERIATGIQGLDRLIEGGIPKATSGVITTDKASPAGVFSQQIIWNILNQGSKCALFHTKYPSQRELLDEMFANGWNAKPYADTGAFTVTDYIALAELTPEEKRKKDLIRNAREVEGRLISVSKLTKLTSKANYDFAIFDDIDLLFRRLKKDQFVDWAETVSKLQKDQGGIALALVYPHNLPADMTGLMDRLGSDCTIELRTNETPDGALQHFFRVTRMKATTVTPHGWVPYIRNREGISSA